MNSLVLSPSQIALYQHIFQSQTMKFPPFCVAVAMFLSLQSLNGQSYNAVFGFRLGDDLALTSALRVAKRHTIQLDHQSALFSNINQTSLIMKKHYPVLTRRINFSLGAGGAMRQERIPGEAQQLAYTPRLALAAGAEITIGKMNIAYEYLPGYNLSNQSSSRFYTSSGIAIRYVIWGREGQLKKMAKSLVFWKRDK
jgi:hypothetical protein